MSAPFPLAEYFNRTLVFPYAELSESGKRVAYCCSLTGLPQVWIGDIPEQGLLSYPKPWTSERGKQPHIFTDALLWVGDRQLCILTDQDGDECTFIEVHDLETGAVMEVPRVAGRRDYLGFVSHDKRHLYFTSNRNRADVQSLWRYSFKEKKTELIYEPEKFSANWSPGLIWKNQYLFGIHLMNGKSELHAIHPKTKKHTVLFAGADSQTSPVAVLSDNKILVLSDYGRKFNSLAILHVRERKIEYLEKDQWDVDACLSSDKKRLILVRNVAGESVASVHAWPSMKKLRAALPSSGVIEGMKLSHNGRAALFAYSSAVSPRELFRLDLKTLRVQRLMDNYTSKVPQRSLVHPKPVKFQSESGTIHAWLYLPRGIQRNGKSPVVVWPHGGPQWQERPLQRPIFQYLLSRGFAIWAPNHTGSTGFGKAFCDAICLHWGTADLPDMRAGVDWLIKSGWFDPKKIAVMGGSYGGYMTLRSITRMPETFKAAVDIFGVSNLLTFSESVPEDWRPFMDKMVGNPERDRERLKEQSPIFELEKVRCPLLVIQGAKDPRVVKTESDRVVEQMKARGQAVEYLVFEDEGHGFLKLENELSAFSQAADFLEKNMQ